MTVALLVALSSVLLAFVVGVSVGMRDSEDELARVRLDNARLRRALAEVYGRKG